MSKGPSTFRKSDFKRGIEAVELAGKRVARIEIDKTGKMAFIVDDASEAHGFEARTEDHV
jgi:hypothetical protein